MSGRVYAPRPMLFRRAQRPSCTRQMSVAPVWRCASMSGNARSIDAAPEQEDDVCVFEPLDAVTEA